jgi:hypothetical protein
MRAGLWILAAALALGAAGAYGGTSKAPGGIEFSYYDPSAYSVSLAGSFNNWDGQANAMAKDAEGTWRAVIQLAPGKHEYKFVVNGSTWMADPENPKVVGDYGNSEVEISKTGEPVAGGAASAISNTIANARVMLNGWFRGSYATRKDARPVYGTGSAALGDSRWRLSRPAHEMYVSVNPTLGSEVKGSLTLRLDSGVGDIREVRADLYAGRIAFEKSMFDVAAYFNEETLALDDPLGALGHQDLQGSLDDDDIAFGRGAQGLSGSLNLAGARFEGSYSNIHDYDIYNNPLRWKLKGDTADVAPPYEVAEYDTMPRYDNVGTDVVALRGKRAFGPVAAGLTFTLVRDGWWVPFDGRNTSGDIDEYRTATGNTSYWFELGTSDRLAAGDLAYSPIEGVTVFGEYGKTAYSAQWDAGNQVRKQGSVLVDGEIDLPLGDTEGTRGKVGGKLERGPGSIAVSYERFASDGMDSGEVYVTMDGLPFEDPDNNLILDYGPALLGLADYRNTYIGVQNLDRFIVYEQAPLPERTFGFTKVKAAAKIAAVDLGLEVDVAKREWQYLYGGSPAADLTTVRVLPSASVSLLGDRLTCTAAYERTTDNLSARMAGEFDRSQLVVKGSFGIRDNWSLYYNFRRASYSWPGRAYATASGWDLGPGSDESFFNPHLALVWSPIPKVEIRLGYGLNPLYYRDTPVEGREVGRDRYMASYLWLDPSASLLDAEQALEDLKMVSLMGVIAF